MNVFDGGIGWVYGAVSSVFARGKPFGAAKTIEVVLCAKRGGSSSKLF